MKKGFYDNIPNNVYHEKDGFYSSSVLKCALEDPNEFYNTYILKKESTKRMNQSKLDLGSAVHTMLLEMHKFWDEFAVFEGATKKGKAWDVFKSDYEGLTHLSQSQYDIAIKMQEVFNKTKIVYVDNTVMYGPDLFKGGVVEQSIYTNIDGLPIKIRPDYRKGHCIRDLKTTEWDFDTKEQAKQLVYGLGYEISAALYVDAYVAAYNAENPNNLITTDAVSWEWVIVSSRTGKTKVYSASKKILDEGRQKYKRAIELIKMWAETGNYISSTVQEI